MYVVVDHGGNCVIGVAVVLLNDYMFKALSWHLAKIALSFILEVKGLYIVN